MAHQRLNRFEYSSVLQKRVMQLEKGMPTLLTKAQLEEMPTRDTTEVAMKEIRLGLDLPILIERYIDGKREMIPVSEIPR